MFLCRSVIGNYDPVVTGHIKKSAWYVYYVVSKEQASIGVRAIELIGLKSECLDSCDSHSEIAKCFRKTVNPFPFWVETGVFVT